MDISTKRSRILAVLGPTNTGKTYLALERMLGHDSGMIGFPLRLLARENYERAAAIKGARKVALITGEEKIIPPYARYFFCTVESMPVTRPVAFVGIDEIQLAADPDRGHVFTDRLLHARGTEETMFMGADAVRPIIRKLVPEAEYLSRPRFSTLSYAGARKIVRLPPRSAVVAFSAADVYAIAELIRRQRGGAAVVLGALSPRTRNAQVALYQEGDVDYLVATDAIGMGLNMDVDHVAFAELRKFDGHVLRELKAAELAQIAGRAGRHMNDGTFGVTADAPELDPETVEAIQSHKFDALRSVYWRNRELDYRSTDRLIESLAARPELKGLTRVRAAEDERVLEILARDEEVAALAASPDTVRLLWDACQIPDFRKIDADSHARLVRNIFMHLMETGGQLPTDWIARQVERIDRTDGDIDTLTGRIANFRTWTYVAHRGDWIADGAEWRERTRAVEDRLSDALHERLTQRFVDHRTAQLVKRLRDNDKLWASVGADGEVTVEGHYVGRLDGFRFIADRTEGELASKAVTGAAFRALRGEIARRVQALRDDGDDAFTLSERGRIEWSGHEIGRLAAGRDLLRPDVVSLAGELVEGRARDAVQARLAAFVEDWIAERFAPLMRVRAAIHASSKDAQQRALGGAARGLAFQLVENLGSLPRAAAARQIAKLESADYGRLKRLGIRLGREFVYMPAMLRPKPAALAVLLWAVHARHDIPAAPPAGRVSIPAEPGLPAEYYAAAGFGLAGPLAIRIDILERVIGELRRLGQNGPFAVPAELMNLAGCGPEEMEAVLAALGYRAEASEDGTRFAPPEKSRKPQNPKTTKKGRRNPRHGTRHPADSPFAKLKDAAITS